MVLNCGAGEHSWKSLEQQGYQVNPKGNHPWISTGRTDAEALILWPPDVKSWLVGKTEAGNNWRAGGEWGDRG